MDGSDDSFPDIDSENDSDSDGDVFFGFNSDDFDNQQVDLYEMAEPNNTNDNENGAESAQLFDDDLPREHLYMGRDLEIVSGRVILTEGCGVTIPLLSKVFSTLIPGQTFPLMVNDHARMELLRKCVATDHTFGCIATSHHRTGFKGPLYGTTAEIYEFSESLQRINVKAKARQRFKVIKTKRADAGYLIGYVEILPEIILGNPLEQIPPLSRFRRSKRDWCRRQEAQLTVWPSWVYDMYDPDKLIKRVKNELTFLTQGVKKEAGKEIMPKDVSQLSFWIATHLDAEGRLFFITLNSPIQRLRWQLNTMTKCQQFICQACRTHVAFSNDIFAMSGEGAQSTYVNPGGILHDTLTFRHATNIKLVSVPSTEFSWFPGYAWSIGECKTCTQHLGWQFTATQRRMKPHTFWGLTRSSLQAKINVDLESNMHII